MRINGRLEIVRVSDDETLCRLGQLEILQDKVLQAVEALGRQIKEMRVEQGKLNKLDRAVDELETAIDNAP